MREYARQTVQNETQTSEEVETLNTNVNAIEEALSSYDGMAGE